MSHTKNRAAFWLGFFGTALTLAGAVVTTVALTHSNSRRNADVLDFCRVALIVGPLMIGQAVLAKQRITIDEAYQFGFDLGEESGSRRQVKRPVVVSIKRPPAATPRRR